MSVSNLARFESETGVELVINVNTGSAYATQAGYARMSGVQYDTVRKRVERLSSSDKNTIEPAEIPTPKGIQTVTLLPAKTIYRWLIKDNPELASEMGEVGATIYLHKLAGYEVTSTAIVKPKSTGDMLLMFAQAFKEHEERLSQLEQQNNELKHQLEAVDMETQANTMELERFKSGHGFYFSIVGWCQRLGLKKSNGWLNAQGRKASALCRQRGVLPVKIPDARYGEVNTYPDVVLEELLWN